MPASTATAARIRINFMVSSPLIQLPAYGLAFELELPNAKRKPVSRKSYFQDLEAQSSHRHLDFDDFADLFSQKALADRARGQNLVFVVVFLAGSDEDVAFFLIQ